MQLCPAGEPARDASIPIGAVVIAGFTGRDERAVDAHIAELEAIGVTRPLTVPVFYRVAPACLTTADAVTVLGTETSGEVEFVVFRIGGELWIGVGSDHTDRDVEAKYGVAASKQMCPKPVATVVWRHADVAPHWDELALRSWATIDGERQPYQTGAVSDMLSPDDLIARHAAHFGDLDDGTAMFCGTFAVDGGPRPGTRFEFELEDPVLDRRIRHAYDVHVVPVRT